MLTVLFVRLLFFLFLFLISFSLFYLLLFLFLYFYDYVCLYIYRLCVVVMFLVKHFLRVVRNCRISEQCWKMTYYCLRNYCTSAWLLITSKKQKAESGWGFHFSAQNVFNNQSHIRFILCSNKWGVCWLIVFCFIESFHFYLEHAWLVHVFVSRMATWTFSGGSNGKWFVQSCIYNFRYSESIQCRDEPVRQAKR